MQDQFVKAKRSEIVLVEGGDYAFLTERAQRLNKFGAGRRNHFGRI